MGKCIKDVAPRHKSYSNITAANMFLLYLLDLLMPTDNEFLRFFFQPTPTSRFVLGYVGAVTSAVTIAVSNINSSAPGNVAVILEM